jgi:alpha-ketoglutarate-dependent taurine dioxygenase
MKLAPLFDSFGALAEGEGKPLAQVESRSIVELLRANSVILFRGFQPEPRDFESFAESLPWNEFVGHGMPEIRQWVRERGTTTLAASGQDAVCLHPELGFLPRSPEVVWFYCVEAAASGGETLVCDGVRLLEKMRPAMREFFLSKRLRYRHHWSADVCRGFFSEPTVPEIVATLRSELGVERVRLDGDGVAFDYVVDFAPQTAGGERAFVNSVLLYLHPEITFLGRISDAVLEDGTPIPNELLCETDELAESTSWGAEWMKGDILLIDNERVMHGRRGFQGKRTIHIKYGRQPQQRKERSR